MKETISKADGNSNCSIVVVYEDPATREEAVKFCDRLVERFWARQEMCVCWFDFARLREPTHALEAVQKALEANVIVFSMHPGGDLPDEVQAWIESWAPMRGDREGALVGLKDPGGHLGEHSPARFVYLRNAAHRAGMDYWTRIPQNFSRSIPDSLESYSERAKCMTSVLDEILHHHPAPSQSI